ncbi:MAG: Single-stranded DNA binding protein [Halodesulfurarchaeum sp.]
MTIDDRAEELASDLGADESEVKQDLENLVSYSVPMDEAVESLRRKYGGGDGGDADTPAAVDIADITPDSGRVTVTGTVLTAGRRRIRYQGDDHEIREGEIADASGRIAYTAWEDFDVSPGDTVTIGNASVREWQGNPELNIGDQTTVEQAAVDVDIQATVGGDSQLDSLTPGDRGRNVEVQVLSVEERTIDGRDGATDILSGVIADPTARLPLTDWDPHPAIQEGASVRLENVYIREFRGVPSVNVTEFSTVEPLEGTIEASEPKRLQIREAVAQGGGYDLELTGSIIDIREGSGLIKRCPECGRVVQKGQCRTHGEVEGEDDLRVKAILDDGTDTVTVILDASLTEAVYGGTVEDAKEEARDAMDQSAVAETIASRLVGQEYRVRGHLSVDDFGANLEASEFERIDDQPADRAASLLEEVRS